MHACDVLACAAMSSESTIVTDAAPSPRRADSSRRVPPAHRAICAANALMSGRYLNVRRCVVRFSGCCLARRTTPVGARNGTPQRREAFLGFDR
ncbi:MAG: hypothetical protein D6744_01885 [Planctomycetota bacterium]|nr:MAG: hypothetical protein D6744_01885 [Planctomycetota bacterium]